MFPRSHSIRSVEPPASRRSSRAVDFFHNATFVLAALGLAAVIMLHFAV